MTVRNAAAATAPASGFTVVYVRAGRPDGPVGPHAPATTTGPARCRAEASCTWSGELAPGRQAPPVTVVLGHGRRAAGTLTSTAARSTAADDEVALADNAAHRQHGHGSAPELAVDVGAPAVGRRRRCRAHGARR